LILLYCKTTDNPKKVGDAICKANSTGKLSWEIIEEIEADTWTIRAPTDRYAHALVYSIGASIVAVEVNADNASNVIEPLMEIYGFENIKWLVSPEKDSA
jgi:hypothetical protein